MLRTQTVDYPVEVLGPRVPQDLLANCDADVVFRRERDEAGDALKIEFQPQINCPPGATVNRTTRRFCFLGKQLHRDRKNT